MFFVAIDLRRIVLSASSVPYESQMRAVRCELDTNPRPARFYSDPMAGDQDRRTRPQFAFVFGAGSIAHFCTSNGCRGRPIRSRILREAAAGRNR